LLAAGRQRSITADAAVQVVHGFAVLGCVRDGHLTEKGRVGILTLDSQTERGRMWRFMR
jgi:hypothetical protein